jgi:hypothetical protein
MILKLYFNFKFDYINLRHDNICRYCTRSFEQLTSFKANHISIALPKVANKCIATVTIIGILR